MFVLCALLVGLFLGLTAAQALAALPGMLGEHSQLSKVIEFSYWGTPLTAQLVWFVLAVIGLHMLWMTVLYSVVRLTVSAFPWLATRTLWVAAAWFALSALTVLAMNAGMFPWSNSGTRLLAWARIPLQTVFLVAMILIALGTAKQSRRFRAWAPRIAVYSAVALAVALIGRFMLAERERQSVPDPDELPNVILIGIDSLRPDVIGGTRQIGLTPNIDRFLRDAHEFSNVVTPLGRTSPAWVSILSGEYPMTSGARENLIPRERLNIERTLPEALRELGYRNTYAIDETRFCNIDETYGFDVVITPPMGTPDWIIGTLNDLPLTNIFANTRLGGWLFPASHGNRAASHVYEPQTFVDMLKRNVTARGPQFMALHLTLPHWPYHHAETSTYYFDPADDAMYAYLSAVISADRQFGALISALEDRGLLKNSIVVLLSDHGEAVGLAAKDSILAGMSGLSSEDTAGLAIPLWGHGGTVLSPSQYDTVLAVRSYGSARVTSHHKRHDELLSLVDIMPTVLDLVGAPVAKGTDGLSFAGLLRGENTAHEFDDRIVFTETGLVADQQGLKVDEGQLVEQAIYYRVNPKNARVEFRADMLPRLIANKERAAISSRWTLVQIPGRGYTTNDRYLAFDRIGNRALVYVPGSTDLAEPELGRIAEALARRYEGEIDLRQN